MTEQMFALFKWVLTWLPYYLVLGIGLWVSLRHRKRSPEPSRLFTLAFVMFAGQPLLGALERHWFVFESGHPASSMAAFTIRYAVTSLLIGLVYYSAWAVLIYAIHKSLKSAPIG